MQIAATTRCYGELTLKEAASLLTDHGFQKIELCLDEDANTIKASEVVADLEAEPFGKIVSFAKLMRIAQVTVPSSPMGTPFNTEIDRLRALTEIGSRDGVRVSINTRRGALSEDPHTAVELCQAVKGLGITLDPSHYITTARGAIDFDVVYPHVFHVQVRDTLPEQLQVQVGLGEVEYSKVVTSLRQLKYNRSISVDLLPGETDEAFEYPLEMRKLRMLLESLLL